MSYTDKTGKRYFTQEDIEYANRMADLIFDRLRSKTENLISGVRATKVETNSDAIVLMKENFRQDFEKLSYLPKSCFRVFYFLFANGASHIYKIRQDLIIQCEKRMSKSAIYDALSKLKENDLVEEIRDVWRIKAKGFLPLCS